MSDLTQIREQFTEYIADTATGKAREKALELLDVWQQLKRSLFRSTPVSMIAGILYWTCLSYYIDVARQAVYHKINNANKYKRAAYLFKWICKLRPIKCNNQYAFNLGREEMFANELFALYAALCELADSSLIYKFGNMSKEELEFFMYMGAYRDVSPKDLELTFKLLEHKYL